MASIPPLAARCRMSVVVPAKNERAFLERSLAALVAQRESHDDRPIDPESYEIIVFCNDCDDDTAAVARRFARASRGPAIHVVEVRLPRAAAHIGTARRMALDLAAERFERAGVRGILASTDADTVVAPTWISAIFREIEGVDAVAGWVTIDPNDRERMLAPLRLIYDREVMYRRAIGLVEATFDPLAYEATPRHAAFVGASFAVTVRAYRAAGGLPVLARLEDLEFERRLMRIDARVRHSYAVRAYTSARCVGRVDGGFASLLSQLESVGSTRGDYLVRSGDSVVANAMARGLARAVWNGTATARQMHELTRIAACGGDAIALLGSAATFGLAWSTFRNAAQALRDFDEPVQRAISAMHARLEAAAVVDVAETATTSQAV